MNQKELEAAVMDKMLDEDNDLFYQLRLQYRNAKVANREITGQGFMTTFVLSDSACCSIIANGKIDDVKAVFTNSEEVYFFILYVTEGKIDALEGFSTLYEWNTNFNDLEIVYCYDNKRDYTLKIGKEIVGEH